MSILSQMKISQVPFRSMYGMAVASLFLDGHLNNFPQYRLDSIAIVTDPDH